MDSKTPVQICVPVCEQSLAAMRQTAVLAAQIGDLVELRLDCLDPSEFKTSVDEIDEWLPTLRCPVILTLRPSEQGGKRPIDLSSRLGFFERQTSTAFCDIELDLALAQSSSDSANWDWRRLICSHHDFSAVPANLEQIYEQMASTPARVLKIAVRADDATDCLPLFLLLDRARKENREMIAICMGIAGIATRILGPSRGAFLTYGSMEDTCATAPGQLTVAELEQLYHITRIDHETRVTGLVGRPVLHSASPHLHNAAFESVGVNAVYIPFEVQDASSFLKRMVHPETRELDLNIRGLSVTAPHKSAVLDLVDWVEPAAREIGAVNTIVVEPDGLLGYNTDGAALVQPLIEKVGSLHGARCAVVGAGGAARAALWSLRGEGASATVFARDPDKARLAADDFGVTCKPLSGSEFHEFDVVINATPLGTRGAMAEQTPVDANQLRGARLAYDLVYNPGETRFLSEATAAGCDTLGGLAMLVSQAAEQFKLWTGVDAPLDVMRKAAARALINA